MATKTIILRPYKVEFADITLTPLYPSSTPVSNAHLLVNEDVSDGDATYINYATGGATAAVYYYFKYPYFFNHRNVTNFSLYMHTRLESSEESTTMTVSFSLPELDESLSVNSNNTEILSADYHYITDNHVNTSNNSITFLSLLNNATNDVTIKCTTNLLGGTGKFAPSRVSQVYLQIEVDEIEMSYNESLQQNNLMLQNILDRINSISISNGEDVAEEDVTEEVNIYTEKINNLTTAINELEAELENKASVSTLPTLSNLISEMSTIETCTLNIGTAIGGLTYFQKDELNDYIELKTTGISSGETIKNIPVNSLIILCSTALFNSVYDIENLIKLDYFGKDNYKVAGQDHYTVFLIQGDAHFSSGNSIFGDYKLNRSGDIANYTLSNTAFSFTNSGESYTTAIETGIYGINSVTVTMGGIDITSTAYNGMNKIHIEQITGDVEITVTVIEPTNLLLTSTTEPDVDEIYNTMGYKDDYRWSSSAGGESSYTGGRLSGWLPYTEGCTYICKNFNPKNGYANGLYIAYRNLSGTNTAVATGLDTSQDYMIDIENDEVQILLQNSNYTHFRVSGYSGDDVPAIYQMCPVKINMTNGCEDHIGINNSIDSIAYGMSYYSKVESDNTNINFVWIDDINGGNISDYPDENEIEIQIKINDIDITNDVFNFDTHEINIPEVTGSIVISLHCGTHYWG